MKTLFIISESHSEQMDVINYKENSFIFLPEYLRTFHSWLIKYEVVHVDCQIHDRQNISGMNI